MQPLLSNPLLSPYFWPIVGIIVALLGSSLAVLVGLTWFGPSRIGHAVLFQRWRTWAIIAPLYAVAILSGPLTTLVLLEFLVFQGLNEYARLVALPPSYRLVSIALGLFVVPTALVSVGAFLILPTLVLMAAMLQPILLCEHHGIRHLAFAVVGWGYVAWFLGHLMLVDRYVTGGPAILLVLGTTVALSDVGAFVAGRRFGRRRIATRLSPNKTWEGVVGAIVGAYVGGLATYGALSDNRLSNVILILPAVVALAAVWGDLFESAIKREFQVKDAGTCLPGFGGLLDRIDSLLIAAPLVALLLWVLG